jgi:hypothetical protein
MKTKLKNIRLFEDFLKKEEELNSKSEKTKKPQSQDSDEESVPVEKPEEEEPHGPQKEMDQEEEDLLSELKNYYKRKGW